MVCPYCSDGFDALGLCVHLEDQHPLEIKLGVCPLCATNMGKNMISHLIIQHEKTARTFTKSSKGISFCNIFNQFCNSTNSATDPLLFSFVSNAPQSHESQADSSAELSSSKILPNNETLESNSNGNIPAGFFIKQRP
ncbi:hypothetical protein L1987_59444 [Smallanthus sonchifolius]|uniref:Uncharacterized protein n=1 Tax=Smallanthus sonchifolius TaxID=185202 RepID=A0ACB9D5D0_9ASTR|nr:hypothetical protein L1987_59444 [Smallanthus sonchifolius]